MGVVSLPNTFAPNTAISSSEVNSNFSTIYNEFNGAISSANLADDAVATAKIVDGAVTTAKLTDGDVTSEKLGVTVAARAYRSTTQSITSGAARKVQLDAENYDLGSDFDSTTNYRFVAPVSGYYQVNAAVTYSNITGGEQVIIYIYKDGAEVASTKCYVPNTSDDPGASISDLVYCAANSYIELYTQCTSTKSLVASVPSSQNYMSIYLVGAA